MILVFGSLNMDLVMTVPSLPRPGETVLCADYVTKPGGKGNNQAIAAARAGAEVMMVGSVGEDDFGNALLENLKANGVNTSGIRHSERPTGMAYICVDDRGENFISVAAGANLDADINQIPESALGLGAPTVLMQMEVPPEQNWALIRHTHETGGRSMLNVAPARSVPAASLRGLDILIVNELDARAVAEEMGIAGESPAELARGLAHGADLTCVLTLGKRGAVAATQSASYEVDGMPIEPVDTTGAGDAFTGILAAALDNDHDLPAALHRASVGASLACLALGAQESLPTVEAIEGHLSQIPAPRTIG